MLPCPYKRCIDKVGATATHRVVFARPRFKFIPDKAAEDKPPPYEIGIDTYGMQEKKIRSFNPLFSIEKREKRCYNDLTKHFTEIRSAL